MAIYLDKSKRGVRAAVGGMPKKGWVLFKKAYIIKGTCNKNPSFKVKKSEK